MIKTGARSMSLLCDGEEYVTLNGERRRAVHGRTATPGFWDGANPVVCGFAIGCLLSVILLVSLPFWFGVCFFLIGSEADPVGPVLFVTYAASILVCPVVGWLIGLAIRRTRRAAGKFE
jgi:hypothetical protein